MTSQPFRYWSNELLTFIVEFYAWIWNDKYGLIVGKGKNHTEAQRNTLNLLANKLVIINKTFELRHAYDINKNGALIQ